MTWPFENDTSAIVKKLADRSMKADKRRNAFIIITIAFAVSLMMVLALYNLGTDRENRLYLQGRYQSSFINSTSTVFEKLEHNNQIESVGKEAAMGTSRINDYALDVYYRDQNALELKGVTDLLGKMPEAENEIIVEQSYLEHLGLPVQLDQTVTLDMPFGKNQTYHVCGIIQSSNASRIYQVIVSDGLYSRYEKANCYDLLVRVKNTENMDSETLKLLINEIAEQSGVPEQYVMYSSTYFGLAEEKSTLELLVIIGASSLIVLACSLVIYSLFYISVIGKTHEYGRLRVLGATSVQIKRIVRKESFLLSCAAIPIGVVLGGKATEILACYEPSFRFMAEWWKQLYGESEGKNGIGIFPASVEYNADLHSMGQYIQDGPRTLMETVVSFEQPLNEFSVPFAMGDPDRLNYLAGRKLSDISRMAQEAVKAAHITGGVPNLEVRVPKRDEAGFAWLVCFFELACAISGYMSGVNPFDQPGVEAYKKNMFSLLGKPETN